MSIYRAPSGNPFNGGRCERLSYLTKIWGKIFQDNNNFFSDNILIGEMI